MRQAPVLFAGNPLPMWIYDVKSLRFLEVNESTERQYGYTREEFLQDIPEEVIQKVHLQKDGTQIYVRHARTT